MIRINKIISKINEKKVIDIGSDHAYLLIEAINKKKIDKGLAVEIAKGPLDNAVKNINNYNLNSVIKAVQSDGLVNVDKEEVKNYDAICICGMGGVLINKIIEDSDAKITHQTLYLQANNNVDKLRRKLMQLGYKITDEELVMDTDIIYEIVVAKKVLENISYSEKELFFGPFILKNKGELFQLKYQDQLKYLEKLLNELKCKDIVNENKIKEYNLIKEQLCN